MVGNRLQQHFGGRLSQSCTLAMNGVSETLFIAPVTAEDVSDIIRSLPNRGSTGRDGISSFFVKKFSDILSPALAHLFNISISEGQFPNALKSSIVVPIPKKGDSRDLTNFRPISLISVISKIFEKAMAVKIVNFLNKHSIVSSSQHGFREGHSAESAVIGMIQHLNDRLDKNEYVIAVSFDLSRAFDTLHPEFLSEKAERLGLRGRVNRWLVSFLNGRSFEVKIGKSRSRSYFTDLGTPQGSVLGPLIFLLYVNDLPEHVNQGEVFSYADDTTIVVSDSSPDGVCQKVERAVSDFKSWCDRNRLMINLSKTVYVRFRSRLHSGFPAHIKVFDGYVKLERSFGFLGTVLDCDLTWQKQVEGVARKLNSSYYAIASLKGKLDSDTLLNIYYGIFYSHISYSIAVWGTSVNAHRIFVLQKRVIRLIFNLDFRQSCVSVFKKRKILTMPCVYLYKTLSYIYVNRSRFITQEAIHSYNTRHNSDICVSQHAHSYYKKSPIFSGISLFNKLPANIKKSSNFCQFKVQLKAFLTQHAFYSIHEYVEESRNLNRF